MQQIKRQISLGNVELARLNDKNEPVPIKYNDLQSTQQTRNNYAKLLSQLKELTPQQKYQWVHIKKLHANQLCKYKKWQEAIDIYLESMLGIDIKQKNQQKQKMINLQQKYPIILNIVTCNYQLKNYKVALQLCDKILQEKDGKNHIKTLYKKVNCLKAIGEIPLAYQKAVQLLKLKNQEKGQISTGSEISKQTIVNLIDEINKKRKNEKQVYQRIFSPKDQQDEQQKLVNKKQEQILVYNYGIKQKCIDFCKQTIQAIRSCLFQRKTTVKIQ